MWRLSTGALACALVLAGCNGVDEPAAAPSEVPVAAPVGVEDLETPDDATLLEEFGSLLVAAASTGGDALERTLRVTADDPTAYDRDCAPTWAHELLTSTADAAPAIDTDDGLLLGEVAVPVAIIAGRALHRTDAPCDEALPQPERSRTPAIAVTPVPSASSTQPHEPTRTPVATREEQTTPDESQLQNAYDAELRLWSEDLWNPIFEMVQEGQRTFGAVGGGASVSSVYDDLADQLLDHRRYWNRLDHPASRAEVRAALLEGLELWSAETRLLGTCASYVNGTGCSTMPGETRAQWRSLFEMVTVETGIAMPSGEPAPPGAPARGPSVPSHGQWNLGDIRLPSLHEVRRSLED